MHVITTTHNLWRSKILIAAMAVERHDSRKWAGGPRRLEEIGAGRRTIGQLPGKLLDVQTIIFDGAMHRYCGHAAGLRLGQSFLQTSARHRSPLVYITKFGAAK